MPSKNLLRSTLAILSLAFAATFLSPAAHAQSADAIRYNAGDKVFRIDAAGVTYAFGVNERSELQPIYWGQRLGANDALAPGSHRHGRCLLRPDPNHDAAGIPRLGIRTLRRAFAQSHLP